MKDLTELLSKLTFGAIKLPEEVSQPTISRSSVEKARGETPRRICFATTHQTALREQVGDGFVGSFSVPFINTVYPIFYRMTGLELFHGRRYGNWWRSLKTADELETVKEWVASVKPLVFLRDQLALSMALAEHQVPEGGHSIIGELEYRAKYHRDPRAIEELTDHCISAISLPYYSEIDAVCAVPPSQGKDFDLPSEIVERIAARMGKEHLTSTLSWNVQKPQLKEERFDQKWTRLEAVGLRVGRKISAKRVLLVDDLYQSGITMQFVAMHLLGAGAEHVYGLALVKSRRDSDNT